MPAARAALLLPLLAPALAGCLGATQPLGPVLPAPAAAPDPALALLEDGGFSLRVPVDVVLVGFDAGTGAALQAGLRPLEVRHATSSFVRALPPDASGPGAVLASEGPAPLPVRPTAVFRVHEAPPAFADAALAFAASTGSEVLDANAMEDWLAARLPAAGVALDPHTPALVLLHGGEALPEGHAWRVTYPLGWLEPVRVFGERHPLLVLDVSAREDPYVTQRPPSAERIVFGTVFGASQPQVYDRPIARGGEETVEALRLATIDAVHHRLLQGTIYPVATAPCHAVTLLLAIRAGSLTEALPGYTPAEAQVDVAMLDAAWENITGPGTVEVDLRVLRLPQDDPVLDAVSRGGLATTEAFRWWLDEHWADYWVTHEGCEPYVSLLVFGDAADADTFGIAMYDVQRSHRIAFIAVNDPTRLRDEWRGPAGEVVGTRDASRARMDWVNLLYAHETGHLLGQSHPHNANWEEGLAPTRWSWSSVWSAMSYQTDDRISDFGAMDRANHLRARAGFLVQEAMALGLQEDPVFAAALAHVAAYRWKDAGDALLPALAR